MSTSKSEAECVDDDIVMFDKPKKTINANVFVVMQVLPNGSALAIVDGNFDNYGITVLFLAREGKSYYDDQRIRVPSNKCVKPSVPLHDTKESGEDCSGCRFLRQIVFLSC